MAIKDKTTENNAGQGFGPQSQNSNPVSTGADQALTLANGLESTLMAQAGSIAEFAEKTQLAAKSMAKPIAQFCHQVSNGDLLMGAIAEELESLQGQSFQGMGNPRELKVNMPQLPSAQVTNDFFKAPKRISGV